MSKENYFFKKTIVPGRRTGSIVIKTEGRASVKIDNPTKEKFIPSYLLNNLRSLAAQVEIEVAGDSADHSRLIEEIDKLKKKYPQEQPEEVWRRTLATLMREGVDAESVAGALLVTNPEFCAKMSLGLMSETEKVNRLGNLTKRILKFWPSASNEA